MKYLKLLLLLSILVVSIITLVKVDTCACKKETYSSCSCCPDGESCASNGSRLQSCGPFNSGYMATCVPDCGSKTLQCNCV